MRTVRRTSVAAGAALGLVLSGLAVGAAADTPQPPPTETAELWVGTLPGPTKAKQDGISLRTKGETTVRTFVLTYHPGADSGWHKHPGIVVAVLRSGTLERQVGCNTEVLTAGDAFTEVAPHDVKNTGTEDAVLSITQILPAPMPTRIDVDPPVCPPRHHHGR